MKQGPPAAKKEKKKNAEEGLLPSLQDFRAKMGEGRRNRTGPLVTR